jgi:hypothetical protein
LAPTCRSFFEGGTVLCVDRGDVLYPLLDRPSSSVVLSLSEFWREHARRVSLVGRVDGSQTPTEHGNDLPGDRRRHVTGSLPGGVAAAAIGRDPCRDVGSGSAVSV